MSNPRSPKAVLTAGYEAFNRRDAAALRSLMVDDFQWNEAEEVPGKKHCRNADEFAAYMMSFDLLWEEFHFKLLELELISADTVIARVVGSGRGKAGGDAVELPIVHVWRFREGRVARMDAYLDPQEASDAAGRPPPADES